MLTTVLDNVHIDLDCLGALQVDKRTEGEQRLITFTFRSKYGGLLAEKTLTCHVDDAEMLKFHEVTHKELMKFLSKSKNEE